MTYLRSKYFCMNYSASNDISNAINHQKTEEMGKCECYLTFTIIIHLLISILLLAYVSAGSYAYIRYRGNAATS